MLPEMGKFNRAVVREAAESGNAAPPDNEKWRRPLSQIEAYIGSVIAVITLLGMGYHFVSRMDRLEWQDAQTQEKIARMTKQLDWLVLERRGLVSRYSSPLELPQFPSLNDLNDVDGGAGHTTERAQMRSEKGR